MDATDIGVTSVTLGLTDAGGERTEGVIAVIAGDSNELDTLGEQMGIPEVDSKKYPLPVFSLRAVAE